MMMFGYGSYGYSLEPEFSAPKLSLADRGWVVVIAHVRGGGEGGADWFKQVLTVHKKLTITDFIACADHLVGERYSRPGRIVAHSFSAGLTLRAGGLPALSLAFAWGGHEGTHTIANVNTSLLGGSTRPGLF